MVVNRAKYLVADDEYHFVTDDKALRVLDSNNNEIGTFRELGFEGKLITSGDYRDIKHTGVYRIKGVGGLPGNIPGDKESILTVTSIGDQNNPELTFYKVISPNGVILENTVSRSNQSGWGSGGVDLRNTITNINNIIGDISKLQTDSKNVTGAINELNSKINNVSGASQNGLEALKKDSDNRYLFKWGDTVNGDLSIKFGAKYKLRGKNGHDYNLASIDDNNNIHIGDADTNLHFWGNDNPTFNGKKIFTEANIGSGSGLDADKLDGIDSSGFLKINSDDTKYSGLRMDKRNIHFNVKDGENTETGLVFDKNNNWTAKVVATDIGDVHIQTGGKEYKYPPFTFNQDRNFVQYGGMHIIRANEPQINFQTFDEKTGNFDRGVGFFKPTWDQGSLAVGNWNTSEVVAQFAVGANHEAVKLNHSPYIGDHNRRLFMQDEQPSGDIPVGSVWIGI